MKKLYKLTDEKGQTKNNTQWGEGITHSGTGEGPLCSKGWIHAYTSPYLAVLLNPIHAGFENPQLWEAEGSISLSDNGLKVGCLSLTTINQITIPIVSKEQRTYFAIKCALEVYKDSKFKEWAEKWISGKDRSESAAWSAARYAARSAAESAWSARLAAEYAAESAAESTRSAAESAARSAEYAARSAEYAARSAEYAARSAARSAAWSAKLNDLAEEATHWVDPIV